MRAKTKINFKIPIKTKFKRQHIKWILKQNETSLKKTIKKNLNQNEMKSMFKTNENHNLKRKTNGNHINLKKQPKLCSKKKL